MSNIYGPILPLQLDSRNTTALVRAIQTRISLESGGELNDFTPASPLAAISEGQAFAQSELLYYLNNLPEAFSLQWLRQLGIQRRIGAKALVDITFYKVPGYSKVVIIPQGTKVYSNSGLEYELLKEVRILESEDSKTIICRSSKWGSIYNAGEGEINKIERAFVGLESLRNNDSATGGKDLESINSMKQRAFEVLSRRNLTTATDFENEVITLAPEASLVKVLTYEERYQLSSALSGNIVICMGDENGNPLSDTTLQYVIESIKNRVTLGTNISIITPEIVPIDLVIEVYYDPTEITGNTDLRASQILGTIQEYINPINLSLGSDLSYQDLLRKIYEYSYVKSVNTLDMKLMIKDSANLEGLCAGFSGEEDEILSKCNYNYIDVINSDNQIFSAPSGIISYKLYNAQVTFTSINDFSPLTYTYTDLYSL
jgi:uncharacterized phage protein gp47/JayE